MFTSRAEYRLTLRADNADQRLTATGHRDRLRRVGAGRRRSAPRRTRFEAARRLAQSLSVTPNEAERHGSRSRRTASGAAAIDLLSHPNIGMADVARIWPQLGEIAPEHRPADRDRRQIRGLSGAPGRRYRGVPARRSPRAAGGLDYAGMTALSNEVRQKLEAMRPRTIGQAGRIDGMTPAALTLLAAHVRGSRKRAKPAVVARQARSTDDLRADSQPSDQSKSASRWSANMFHVKHGSGSSRYVELLMSWQQTLNLVAASTLPQIWTRHIADSLQLLPLAPERQKLARSRLRRRLSGPGDRLRAR